MLIAVYCKKKFFRRCVREALIEEYADTSLEITVLLCWFSRILIVDFWAHVLSNFRSLSSLTVPSTAPISWQASRPEKVVAYSHNRVPLLYPWHLLWVDPYYITQGSGLDETDFMPKDL